MNQFIIEKYINKLTKQDIINYANNQNIILPESDVNTIYYYIKNKYTFFLQGHQEELLNEIKHKVTHPTYLKLEELYNLYKNKI